MIKINKEFLNNYKAFDLNINANNIGEAAISNEDYIFFPLDITEHGVLITKILNAACDRNHDVLLPKWINKPASDKTLAETSNSYLINQFSISKENIKREIPLTGEESAKSRFSQLLKTYLPIFVLYITYVNDTPGGMANISQYLSWDEDNMFLPLPIDKNSGNIIWNDIYENVEDSVESIDPVTYDTKGVEILIDDLFDKLCKKINHKFEELKLYIDEKLNDYVSKNSELNHEDESGEEDIVENTDVEEDVVEDRSVDIDELEKLKKENEQYTTKISDLEDTISVLKNDKDDLMKITKEKDGAISELKNDIGTLEATVVELEEELNEVRKSTNKETEDTSAIIGVKDNEIAELKRELETRKENEQLLRDRNAELEEADNTLRKDLTKATEDNTNLTRKLAEVQNEISDKIDENRKLERQVVNLKSDNESFIKEIKSLKRDIESLKSQNGNKEIENLMEDNRILRKALDDYKNRENNKQYINKQDQNNQQKVSEKTEEELAREKANRDRIGRMIYGDAYDGTQTF